MTFAAQAISTERSGHSARTLALRACLEALVEAAIDLLDHLDGDPDLEDEAGTDQDVAPVTLNPERMLPARRVRR